MSPDPASAGSLRIVRVSLERMWVGWRVAALWLGRLPRHARPVPGVRDGGGGAFAREGGRGTLTVIPHSPGDRQTTLWTASEPFRRVMTTCLTGKDALGLAHA